MIMSNSGLPLKVGHKIHLETFQFLLLALFVIGSQVVGINAFVKGVG
jgi:hypothetical protein